MTTSNYMASVVVEIAFDSGFSTPAADRTWTDVSDDVELAKGISTGYGRADEFGVADANTLTLTLDNTGGNFTPEKTTGPHYPNVKIGRPIRVTVTRAGAVSGVERFDGYIDAWNLSSSGANPTVTVSAYSQIARFGLSTTATGGGTISEIFAGLEGIYALCETLDPLGDTREVLPDLLQVPFAPYGSAPQYATGLGPDGAGTAVRLNDAALAPLSYPVVTDSKRYPTGLLVNDECVIEFWAAEESGSELIVTIGGHATHATLGVKDQTVDINLGAGSDVTVTFNATPIVLPVTLPAQDGSLHHFAVRLATGTIEFWVDGVLTNSTTGTNASPFTDIQVIVVGNAPSFDVDVSYLAISNDGSTIPLRALIGLQGQDDRTASDRIELCAAAARAQATDIDVTTDMLDALSVIDKTLIDLIRAAETTDGGVLFDALDGTLTYRTRTARYNSASAFTLDASAQQVEASLGPRLDRSALTNEVTVTRTDADDFARASDFDSIDAYGISRTSFEIQADYDHCLQAASWAIFLHGEPGTRIPNLEVDLLALSAATQDAILAAEIGTRFTVVGLPAEFAASTLDFFLEGGSDAIGAESYRVTFNVSPRDPAKFNVWVVGDATYGAYDSNPIAY